MVDSWSRFRSIPGTLRPHHHQEDTAKTLVITDLDPQTYADLRALADAHGHRIGQEAQDILRDGVERRIRWLNAKLSDLSDPNATYPGAIPYDRSYDLPRDVDWDD
jgi:hypothetical protein